MTVNEPELVHVAHDGAVATITLDSPDNRNALSRRVRAQLQAALTELDSDDATRVVLLTHTGSVFCAGMDLKETVTDAPGKEGVRELPAILRGISHCRKPVVAVLAGAARAGGVGLAAACDIVIAAETVTFAVSEVRHGVLPATISVPLLARVAPAAARELMLTGEVFDAARAAQIGLVNAVAPADRLAEVADKYVRALLAGGPTALAGTKQLLAAGLDDSAERYDALRQASAAQFASAEAKEGAAAFAAKRDPAWIA